MSTFDCYVVRCKIETQQEEQRGFKDTLFNTKISGPYGPLNSSLAQTHNLALYILMNTRATSLEKRINIMMSRMIFYWQIHQQKSISEAADQRCNHGSRKSRATHQTKTIIKNSIKNRK